MEFARQEYWNRLPFLTPEDLPNPGIEPTSSVSPTLAGRFCTTVVVVQWLSHVQFCDTMNCSTPCLPLPHHLPLNCWCHSAISASVTLFSFCLPFFPASRAFPVSQLFASGSQSIGAPASTSVLLMNIQGWFHLRLTGLISLLSKGLSRAFSSTIRATCKSPFAFLRVWNQKIQPTQRSVEGRIYYLQVKRTQQIFPKAASLDKKIGDVLC